MTDPLGRPGYAIAPGAQDPNPAPGNFNPLRVILIDPQTGSLLATAEIGPMPGTLHCLSFSTAERNERNSHWRHATSSPADRHPGISSHANRHAASSSRANRHPARSLNSYGRCVGPSFSGRSYAGQIDEYVAVLSEGWTNAAPPLPPPADRSGNGCCAGLPPLP
jgi:hypothetical protein